MATVIYILLRQQIDYPVVLSILLTSAVGAVILHIPAGLGVVEGLFITLLRDQMPRSSVMAAMIAYRAIYFLLPLLPAAAVYFAAEMRSRRGAKAAVDGSRAGCRRRHAGRLSHPERPPEPLEKWRVFSR